MKADTLQRIEMTKDQLKNSFDNFVVDSLTGCYNELFMREYLINYVNLMEETIEMHNLILVYINVDDIVALNLKYSSETGDETIANLGYILKQMIKEEDLLIKKRGPGFIVLLHNCENDSVRVFTDMVQNSVKKAEVFIEPITVSTAIVQYSEVKNINKVKDKVDRMMDIGQRRINLSYRLGDNSYIDEHTVMEKESAGNILLVESDPLTVKIIRSSLEENHYKVFSRNDGIAALEIAEKIKFDAIIADRYTRKIDGLTLKQHLNQSTINMNSLFILTSQNKNIELIEKANHINVNFVLKKPIIFQELLGIMVRHLSGKEKYLI